MTKRTTRLRGGVPDEALNPEDLGNIRSPVLLIWGQEDPMGSVEDGRAGAEHFPDAEFHEMGVGHAPWFDEPETCGQMIRDFINRNS